MKDGIILLDTIAERSNGLQVYTIPRKGNGEMALTKYGV